MTKAYHLKVLYDIVKDSKYFQNEAIDFYLSSEQLRLFYYGSYGSFIENIYLFGKEEDEYLISNMVIELDNSKILWYNCTNGDDKSKDNDLICIYLRLFSDQEECDLLQLFNDKKIVFYNNKNLHLYKKCLSVFANEKFLMSSMGIFISQSLITIPYLLKCSHIYIDTCLLDSILILNNMLPSTIVLSFINLLYGGLKFREKNQYRKKYFSKFDFSFANLKRNFFIFFYSVSLANSLISFGLNKDMFAKYQVKIEAEINDFLNSSLKNEQDMTRLEEVELLEEAINNNPNLDEAYKKAYLKNLKVLDLCSSNLDFKRLYPILSNTDVIDLECNVVDNSYDYVTMYLAFQYSLDNNIYDLVNAYNHDDLDLCDLIRSHEVAHNLVDNCYYSWFIEGFNSFSQYEFFGYFIKSYERQMVIVKYFCELLGTETVKRAYYDGNEDILKDNLIKIDSTVDVDMFFESLNNFGFRYTDNNKEAVTIMKNYAEKIELSDESRMYVDSYLSYLGGYSLNYLNKNYLSDKNSSDLFDVKPVLVKSR